MATPTVLVASWENGVHAVTAGERGHAMPGQPVRGLVSDGRGGALAIVGGHTLCRRDPSGAWTTILVSEMSLASCLAVGDAVYAGTDDARVVRVDARGGVEPLPGFDTVAGRDTWYAGAAMVDGRLMGPPLGVRSMSATVDGVLLVNVHVGGIPRSADAGATWAPTIDVESDVHEVRAHPTRANIVVAAAAVGLCTSRDGGVSWKIEESGLHAPHASAVAIVGDDVLISASVDPFSPQGAVYRRPVDGSGPLERVGNGLPEWVEGKVDTSCIAARGDAAALCDFGGNLYLSEDAGRTWSRVATGLWGPSSVLIV